MFDKALVVYYTTLLAVTCTTAQTIGTWESEIHPKLDWKRCSSSGVDSCQTVQGELTVDSNWRWAHENSEGGYRSCVEYAMWNKTLCPDGRTCAENCAIDGAQYKEIYGVTTSSDVLKMKYVTHLNFASNIASRLFLMNGAEKYQMFTLLGNEFSFDVDTSKVGCGINAALNFVSMDEDGGLSRYAGNKAGARYGTGYCDANCPRDLRFINGLGNSEGWYPSEHDSTKGYGNLGSCCPQMAIWCKDIKQNPSPCVPASVVITYEEETNESLAGNSFSTSMAAHPCQRTTQEACTGTYCGGKYPGSRYRNDGECDSDGCDFNPYRQGNQEFYGPGKTIDTNKKFTVITQFVKGDDGKLESIRRFYQQDGRTIANAYSSVSGVAGNSIDGSFCPSQKKVFDDKDYFSLHGGMEKMSEALSKGMVLSMSIWHDDYANMLWLDGAYPPDRDILEPGVARGSCSADSGVPSEVIYTQSADQVAFSNFRFGPLNSTFT